MEFRRKEVWSSSGKNFSVTIVRWSFDTPIECQGPNNWNVYAYIFSDHPTFKFFNKKRALYHQAVHPPLHGGPTYLDFMHAEKAGYIGPEETKWLRPRDYVKIGCDYMHLHDDRFSYMDTLEDAYEVKADAMRLFEWLAACSEDWRPGDTEDDE